MKSLSPFLRVLYGMFKRIKIKKFTDLFISPSPYVLNELLSKVSAAIGVQTVTSSGTSHLESVNNVTIMKDIGWLFFIFIS